MIYENGTEYGLEILKKELKYQDIKSKKIIIFGFNSGARLCVYYLHSLGISNIVIVDNSKRIRAVKGDYCGVPICAPEEILEDVDNDVIIVITALRVKEIRENIKKINPSFSGRIVSCYLQDKEKMFVPLSLGEGCRHVDLREGQVELLRMMKVLHAFCEERDIKYMLAYGTLLGAVRHKGFIPWDDDVDVYMPWNDYVRFCAAIEEEKPFNYKCMLCESSKMHTITTLTQIVSDRIYSEYYNYPLRTNQGLTIDVWPIVNYPNDVKAQKEYEYELIAAGDEWKENVLMGFGSARYDKEKHMNVIKKLYETMNKYSEMDSLYVGDGYCGRFEDLIRVDRVSPKAYYEKRLLVDFEDAQFWIPAAYDEILTSFYNDYMKLPDEDKRVPQSYKTMFMKEV